MRPWRLSIEFGRTGHEDRPYDNPRVDVTGPEPTPVTTHRGAAWDALVEARRNLLNAQSRGDTATANQINLWIGGALSLMATITGDDAKELDAKLRSEVPSETATSTTNEDGLLTADTSRASFYRVERTRPKPPPGAPRPLNPEDLTPEERAQLGIILPGEEPPVPSEQESPAPSEKKPVKRAAAKKSAAKRAAKKAAS